MGIAHFLTEAGASALSDSSGHAFHSGLALLHTMKGVPNREAWVCSFPTAQARTWCGGAPRLYPAVVIIIAPITIAAYLLPFRVRDELSWTARPISRFFWRVSLACCYRRLCFCRPWPSAIEPCVFFWFLVSATGRWSRERGSVSWSMRAGNSC